MGREVGRIDTCMLSERVRGEKETGEGEGERGGGGGS